MGDKKWIFPLCFFALSVLSGLIGLEEPPTNRTQKLFSLFNVIRFENGACSGTANNGTCYTENECRDRRGTNSGTCANGYGVCCVFNLNCGQTSNENVTYFSSVGNEVGSCSVRICKGNSDICQIRLDFMNFVINGPSTSTITTAKILQGAVNSGGNPATSITRCETDRFTVSNPGGITPPVLCGSNSQTHMYLEASDLCNDIGFQLGTSSATTARQWNIRITQYSCDFENRAPAGCTQYFFGILQGIIQTYNYDDSLHLANQNQNICIRRERNRCEICYDAGMALDFQVSGNVATMGYTKASECCGYGIDGKKDTRGYDCVVIPSAIKSNGMPIAKGAMSFCGNKKGLVSVTGGAAVTLCSRRTPFEIRFISDNYEWAGEMGSKGFKLNFKQNSC